MVQFVKIICVGVVINDKAAGTANNLGLAREEGKTEDQTRTGYVQHVGGRLKFAPSQAWDQAGPIVAADQVALNRPSMALASVC